MDAEEKMKKARIQLLLDNPFFGHLGSYLGLERDDSLESPVSTDHEKLYFNPSIVGNLDESKVKASIAHGVLHTALGHQWRRGGRSEESWDPATDEAVNWVLKESGFDLPPTSEPSRRFRDKSAEEIYSKLEEKRGKKDLGGVGGEPPESGRKGEGKQEGPAERGEKGRGEGKGPLDDHGPWSETGQGDHDQGEVSEEWKRRAAESSAFAGGEGRMSEALERVVEEILEPKVDWRKVLRRYVLRHAREDYDWMRPDRRLLQHGIYYPSPRSERLDLAIAVDTSGSIRGDVLKKFLSEVGGILQSAGSYRARILACDAEVHSDMSIGQEKGLDVETAVEEFSKRLKGRGGTRYSPVFEALDEESIRVLVYLTDGRCSENLEKPRYDVVWALPEGGTEKHLEFGEVVKLEGGNTRTGR